MQIDLNWFPCPFRPVYYNGVKFSLIRQQVKLSLTKSSMLFWVIDSVGKSLLLSKHVTTVGRNVRRNQAQGLLGTGAMQIIWIRWKQNQHYCTNSPERTYRFYQNLDLDKSDSTSYGVSFIKRVYAQDVVLKLWKSLSMPSLEFMGKKTWWKIVLTFKHTKYLFGYDSKIGIFRLVQTVSPHPQSLTEN